MKQVVPILIAVAMLATLAYATDPPVDPVLTPPPASYWGYDCGNWVGYWGPYESGEMCFRWDPTPNYYYCETGLVEDWPEMVIDLFVEMEMAVTFDWTQAQIHRASLYDDFELELHGTIASNTGNWIIVQPFDAWNLNQLTAQTSVYGALGDPVPLVYEYWNGAAWVPMTAVETETGWGWGFTVIPCYQEFWIRITGDIAVHQADGWYTMIATLCPLPEL